MAKSQKKMRCLCVFAARCWVRVRRLWAVGRAQMGGTGRSGGKQATAGLPVLGERRRARRFPKSYHSARSAILTPPRRLVERARRGLCMPLGHCTDAAEHEIWRAV